MGAAVDHGVVTTFPTWQRLIFWPLWLSLALPLYFGVAGARLVAKVLTGDYAPLDFFLLGVLSALVFLVTCIACSAAWHFSRGTRGYLRLFHWLCWGVFVLPVWAFAIMLYAYTNLSIA